MISVGIDPGTYATGVVALAEGKGSERPTVLSMRTIKPPRSAQRVERLATLLSILEGMLLRMRPDLVVVEAGSVQYARPALAVSEARGVALALGERCGARVAECHVQAARKALGVARFGQRRIEGKRAVEDAVAAVLGLRPWTEDEADAAALAWWGILHGHSMVGMG